MAGFTVPGLPEGSIIVDEIGLETGLCGPYRLKSVYQPIFRLSQTQLMPVGVEAFVQPRLDLEPVAPDAFLATVPVEQQGAVKALCRALHIGNYQHIGGDHLQLHLNCDTGAQGGWDEAIAQMGFMATLAAEVDLAPELVFCGFIARDMRHEDVPARLVETLHANGFRLAIDDFGPGHSVLDRIQRIRPNVVKIDGGWFRRIAGIAAATRLLAKLIGGLQRDGAQVLIKGIETAEQLNVARAVGADLVQGFLLGRPALAGVALDPQPLDIERFFRDPGAVIVPLRERVARGD
ncbi:EAL domain-containing protein [Nitratireductor soli]|uniref:EAL domain-containing protein n=1 Tax=Nitratireductor soli TaxID=1670619 RepID=UPI00065DE30E|nr:EAL domain-containing protein [Nitratireductor soli]